LTAYADTSFIASLYLTDANSERATAIVERLAPPWFIITEFSRFELINALRLRVFRGELTHTASQQAESVFESHVKEGLMIDRLMVAEVYSAACELAQRWTHRLGTRALDVLHVASALVLEADSFHTFDGRQARLGKAAGLKTT
jgi:predicted nucleic acid-binding protein